MCEQDRIKSIIERLENMPKWELAKMLDKMQENWERRNPGRDYYAWLDEQLYGSH